MAKLRLYGDVHGDGKVINDMIQTCHRFDLTIQMGDFGAGFGAEYNLDRADSELLKVLHGNHDNPQILNKYPHNLGRFGVHEFAGKKIFFVAGAWSIDRSYRTPGVDWWEDEELSYTEAEDCLVLWEQVCGEIDLVISHDGPPNFTQLINGSFPKETHTGRLLWEMWKIHQPPLWRIGHWHKSFSKKIENTHFKCLSINEKEVLEW